MFKHLMFRIKNYRTIKEICRICKAYKYHIEEKNKELKKIPSFSYESMSEKVTININNLKVVVYQGTILFYVEVCRPFPQTTYTYCLFSYCVDSIKDVPVFLYGKIEQYKKYTPLIESTLNQILSILKEFEKEIIEKKAKEEADRLADIDKILLKR